MSDLHRKVEDDYRIHCPREESFQVSDFVNESRTHNNFGKLCGNYGNRMHPNHPLLSVVIPTHRRPEYLPIAIDSALQAERNGDVEVIVVPNGPDESWKFAAETYRNDPRVRWHPITKGHANAARNHGKQLARGKYIRFLDDDDALSPTGSTEQLEALQRDDVDVCSGTVEIVDEYKSRVRLMPQADQHDLFTAMAKHERVCQPTAHVFKRSALIQFDWDESIDFEQDTEWMLRLSSQREWSWSVLNDIVGYWTQHGSRRVSGGVTHSHRWQVTALMLGSSTVGLRERGALTPARCDVLAQTLWHYVHQDFFAAPLYWSKKAILARQLSPKSRPAQKFFSYPGLRRINPLLLEWLILPKRQLNHLLRLARGDDQ